MEWKLTDVRKVQYDEMIKSAQDVEANIGVTTYRIAKMVDMRKSIDDAVRTWWEEILKEYNLDKNIDYVITREGSIQTVDKPETPVVPVEPSKEPEQLVENNVGTNAAELK